jgi:hypothetical protein
MSKRIYLSGPMSGLPDYNRPAFFEAERQLIAAGYAVISPARNGLPESATWQQHMRRNIAMLIEADGVALLPGWYGSRDAEIEDRLASELDIPSDNLGWWLANAAEQAAK